MITGTVSLAWALAASPCVPAAIGAARTKPPFPVLDTVQTNRFDDTTAVPCPGAGEAFYVPFPQSEVGHVETGELV